MENFFELWGTGETRREELIVMLGGIYTLGTERFILGETQFLREHHGNPNIISWTHFIFEVIANEQGTITHRKFLDNALLPDCIAECLRAFSFLK
ncbi:MAG: hypothetical protein LBD69_03240 [Puniceicoccales bacterium]|jgi:hypothetical protein|nr:hypothetical protein [Puniceicoccales bacterium]